MSHIHWLIILPLIYSKISQLKLASLSFTFCFIKVLNKFSQLEKQMRFKAIFVHSDWSALIFKCVTRLNSKGFKVTKVSINYGIKYSS